MGTRDDGVEGVQLGVKGYHCHLSVVGETDQPLSVTLPFAPFVGLMIASPRGDAVYSVTSILVRTPLTGTDADNYHVFDGQFPEDAEVTLFAKKSEG